MSLHIPLSMIYYDLLSAVLGKSILFLKIYIIIRQSLDHYLKVSSQTAVFPTDGNFDKLALCYTLLILLITFDSFSDASN